MLHASGSFATNSTSEERPAFAATPRLTSSPVLVYTLAASSAAPGDVDGHYVLSFKADADGVLSTEAKRLLRMRTYTVILTDLMVSPRLESQGKGT